VFNWPKKFDETWSKKSSEERYPIFPEEQREWINKRKAEYLFNLFWKVAAVIGIISTFLSGLGYLSVYRFIIIIYIVAFGIIISIFYYSKQRL
jgi:hypothetical protein